MMSKLPRTPDNGPGATFKDANGRLLVSVLVGTGVTAGVGVGVRGVTAGVGVGVGVDGDGGVTSTTFFSSSAFGITAPVVALVAG
jgi:TPP-dependent pyruvate/acetoin dehydrogenase alpha subunit